MNETEGTEMFHAHMGRLVVVILGALTPTSFVLVFLVDVPFLIEVASDVTVGVPALFLTRSWWFPRRPQS